MSTTPARIAIVLAIALCASVFIFIGGQVLTLADMAGRIHPFLGDIVFWVGTGAMLTALGWLAATYLMRPRPLEMPQDGSPEALAEYRRALETRLRTNPHLLGEEVTAASASGTPKSLEDMLSHLDAAALRETRRTASRIFLTTAIARNGRLDTLIVLVLLARLVWRISALYDSRPHPRAMLRLYLNVAGTALAAGALEDAGLEDHIHALLTPLLAASPMTSVPGISGVGTVLTASLVDGSANALLALRVGIVTRNLLSPPLPGMPERPSPYREASALLVRMSGGLVRKVMKAAMHGLTAGLTDKARRAANAVRQGMRGKAPHRDMNGTADATMNAEATESAERRGPAGQNEKQAAPINPSAGGTGGPSKTDSPSRSGTRMTPGNQASSQAAYRAVPLRAPEMECRDGKALDTDDATWERIGPLPGITYIEQPDAGGRQGKAVPGQPDLNDRNGQPGHNGQNASHSAEAPQHPGPQEGGKPADKAAEGAVQDAPRKFSPARRLLRSLLLKRPKG